MGNRSLSAEPTVPAPPSRIRYLLLVAALVAAAAGLGVWRLGERSLWDDEATSLEYARMTPGEIWRDRDPNVSPFYYELLHVWRAVFGEREAALRSLSAIGRVLGLLAVIALGAAVLGVRGGMVAGALYALSPPALLYGREMRAYPLLLAFSCAGLAGLWKGGTSRKLAWALAAGVAFAAALMMHFSTLFLLGGIVVAHLHPSLRGQRKTLGVTLAVIGASVLPWADVFRENLSNLLRAASGPEQVPIPFGPPGKAAYALFVMVLGETVLPWNWPVVVPAAIGSAVLCVLGWRALAEGRALRVLPLGLSMAAISLTVILLGQTVIPWNWAFVVPAAIGSAVLGVYGWRAMAEHRAYLVVPLAVAVLALSFTMKAGPRYVFLLLPCLLVLFAAGACGKAPLALRLSALAALLVPQVYSIANLYAARQYHNMAMVEPTREVASFVRGRLRPGDLLVYTSPSVRPLLHYMGASPSPQFLSPVGEAKVCSEAGEETFAQFLSAAQGKTVWWIERSRGFVPEAGEMGERAAELRAALIRRGSSTEWRFGHDPDVADKRRWVKKEFLEDRIVVVRFDP